MKLFDRDTKLALLAVVTLLYGAWPMFVFGWLLATIARHPEVVAALRDEYAYRYAMWGSAAQKGWRSGLAWRPPVLSFAVSNGSFVHSLTARNRSSCRACVKELSPTPSNRLFQHWHLSTGLWWMTCAFVWWSLPWG